MSYNNVRNEKGLSVKRSALSASSDALSSLEITKFDGVNLSGGAFVLNMENDGNALQTRCGVEILNMGEDVPSGAVDADCFDDGKYVFKKGAYLFMYDAARGECYKERDDLPEDVHCVIYHIYGYFAVIHEDGNVFLVSDDFSHETEKTTIHVPLLYSLYTEKQTQWNPLNMLTEYFRVHTVLGYGNSCELPSSLFVDGDFYEVRDINGNLLSSNVISFTAHEDGGATIYSQLTTSNLYITLRLKHDETGTFTTYDDIQRFREMFFYPLGAVNFPSNTNDMRNLLLYGGENEKKFTVFCLTELIFVREKNMTTFENVEKISSVLRYSDDYLLYSPHYIRKMTLTEDSSADVRFSVAVENFKYDVGCDMPKSAVCTDDKIIYANSKAGVFYLDRFGFSQRDMSRNVSANIEGGEYGLLACGAEALENAQAVICGGKYYLCVGDVFYVWNFRHAVPSSSTEKLSESMKMRWNLYSGLSCARIVGTDVNEFYFVTDEGELARLASGSSLEAAAAESFYESEDHVLSPFGKAVVFKLSLSISATENCIVRCYFDGEESNAKYVISPQVGAVATYEIRPEKHRCRKFAFSVSSFGAIRIEGARVEWY